MRILNVLFIENGWPRCIESFPVVEEQLSDEVVKEAENLFISLIEPHFSDFNEDDRDYYLAGGYYERGGFEVHLMWSESENI